MTFLDKTDSTLAMQTLQGVLNARKTGRVYLAAEEGGTVPGLHTSILSCPGSFVTVVRGKATYQIIQQRKLTSVELIPGDMLLRLSHTWITLQPTEDYLSLGGRFEVDQFRFFFSEPIRARRRKTTKLQFVDLHKTPYLYCRAKRQSCVPHLLDALSCSSPKDTQDPLLIDLTHSLIHCMLDALTEPDDTQTGGKAYNTFNAACSFIDEHCCQNISRQDVANALQINQTHVSRLFKQFSKLSFNEHLIKARLVRAHALLTNPTLTIAQIADMCGFGSPSYFTRLYRYEYGHAPHQWRKQHAQSQSTDER
ncbi:MAG: helix-turn-helix transcriptional regulator [Phycisphaeraceae bacterium JB051]